MELLRPAVTAHARAHTGVYRVYRVYIGGTLYRGYIGVGVTMELLRPAVTANARAHTGVGVYKRYIGGTLYRGI